jgi:hypothetical protein
MPRYLGSCHCGAVEFAVDADPVELTVCDCSLCRRKNALMLAVPVDQLAVLRGEDKLSLYQWNTGAARHHFCSVCGIYTFHRKRSDPNSYGVNVNCLEGFDASAVPVRQADGLTMTVEAPGARDAWPGPRV